MVITVYSIYDVGMKWWLLHVPRFAIFEVVGSNPVHTDSQKAVNHKTASHEPWAGNKN